MSILPDDSMDWSSKRTLRLSLPEVQKKNYPYRVVLYTKGFNEHVKNICSKDWIQIYLKWGRTINNLWTAFNNRDTIWENSGVFYRYRCAMVECDEEYSVESTKTFGEMFKECHKNMLLIWDEVPFNTPNLINWQTLTS